MALTRFARELTHLATAFKSDRGLRSDRGLMNRSIVAYELTLVCLSWPVSNKVDRLFPGEPGECHSPLRDLSSSIAIKTDCNAGYLLFLENIAHRVGQITNNRLEGSSNTGRRLDS